MRTTVDVDHKYKQWVSSDRCELIEVVRDRDGFICDVSVYVLKLTSHHYQIGAFKEYKENVAEASR